METRSRGKCAFVREFQWILESLFYAGLGFWKEIADHGCSPQTEVMLCTCFCSFVFLKNDFYCSVTEVHLMGLNKTGGYWVEAEDECFLVTCQPIVLETTFIKKCVDWIHNLQWAVFFSGESILNGLMSLPWSLELLTTCYKRTVMLMWCSFEKCFWNEAPSF